MKTLLVMYTGLLNVTPTSQNQISNRCIEVLSIDLIIFLLLLIDLYTQIRCVTRQKESSVATSILT